jgi:hypothetical protein
VCSKDATPSVTSRTDWLVLGVLGRVQVGVLQAASHSRAAATKAFPEMALMKLPAARATREYNTACRDVLHARQPLEVVGVMAVQIAAARARVVANQGWLTRDGKVATLHVQPFDAYQPPCGESSDDDGDDELLPPVKHVKGGGS